MTKKGVCTCTCVGGGGGCWRREVVEEAMVWTLGGGAARTAVAEIAACVRVCGVRGVVVHLEKAREGLKL